MDLSLWGILKALWGVLGWLWSLLRLPNGPALTIAPASIRNSERQDIYPRFIVFENSGTASAFNVEAEIRTYYDPILRPTYDPKKKRLSTALKPGDQFRLELLAGSDESSVPGAPGLALADFYCFEVFVRYQNAGKQNLLSYVRIGMVGEIEHRDHAVNPLRRAVLPTEIWCRHFFPNLWIHAKVRARPNVYRLLSSIRNKVSESLPPLKVT
jgi:hypothetical protein